MPNWCNNDLQITGPKEQIKRFKEKAKGKEIENIDVDLLLSSIIPPPKDIGDNWYQWNIENYGCKWDCNGILEESMSGEGELYYTFDSPWSPPLEWLKQASAKFPKLKFKLDYREDGMGYMGWAKASKGEIEDHEEPYKHIEGCECDDCIAEATDDDCLSSNPHKEYQ